MEEKGRDGGGGEEEGRPWGGGSFLEEKTSSQPGSDCHGEEGRDCQLHRLWSNRLAATPESRLYEAKTSVGLSAGKKR